jgi:enterochelin esterase-like enzyme
MEFSIYLPPCYQFELTSDYPVIYLLHGLTYTNDQWPRLGLVETMDSLIAQGEIPAIIIVLPREKHFQSPETSNFPDALVLELIPWIDQAYRTLTDASHHGIGGISRGAAWAVRIGFTHPDHFSRIGAHSLPVFAQDTNQVQVWASQTPPKDLPVTLIDIGRNDREVQSALEFANQLDRYNLPHEFYLFNGEHTEAYWTDHLEFYLRWYTQDW